MSSKGNKKEQNTPGLIARPPNQGHFALFARKRAGTIGQRPPEDAPLNAQQGHAGFPRVTVV